MTSDVVFGINVFDLLLLFDGWNDQESLKTLAPLSSYFALQRGIGQASNIPRGMWVVAAAFPPHEISPEIQIRLILVMGPAKQ